MKVKNLVPEVYYRDSRDFSYIGRVCEILFNYMKTNVDLVGQSPVNEEVPDCIVDLLATTLGFESKHKYQTLDLVSICSSFTELLRNKGNRLSIEEAVTILMRTQNINEEIDIDVDEVDKHKYIIYVPKTLDDIILLEDLFEYILPTGVTYSFRIKSSASGDYKTDVEVEDNVETYTMSGHQLGQVGGKVTGFDNTDESKYGSNENRSMTYTGTIPGEDDDTSENGGN